MILQHPFSFFIDLIEANKLRDIKDEFYSKRDCDPHRITYNDVEEWIEDWKEDEEEVL